MALTQVPKALTTGGSSERCKFGHYLPDRPDHAAGSHEGRYWAGSLRNGDPSFGREQRSVGA